MGAVRFKNYISGDDPKKCFETIVSACRAVVGCADTGTIADKHAFDVIEVPSSYTVEEYLEHIQYDHVDRETEPDAYRHKGMVNSKYGPAVAIKYKDGWLFVGSAPE